MLHRNGTRLEIGTSEDVAELELVEARRLAEIQRRHHRAGAGSGDPRPTGGSGSTVLSYGSVPLHTRTPARTGGTVMPAEHTERSRATTTTIGSPGSAHGGEGSWRSPTATTNPSPSVVRPSHPAMSASPVASPYDVSGRAGVAGGAMRASGSGDITAYPGGGHFPDISSIVTSDESRLAEGRGSGLLAYPPPSPSSASPSAIAAMRSALPAAGSAQVHVDDRHTVPTSATVRASTRLMQPPYASPYRTTTIEERLSGGSSTISTSGARTPQQERTRWPPPPSAFMHNAEMRAEAHVWDEELRREHSEDMEPSPTRRSGLLPPE